ncbi:hypothetical protein [Botrimarina hoheduenensis]|uniref:Lipoprotein n=1 Tax=Botrimarina hoheduenensis TaxID=2528000 RepID=A0A5C5W931_9BACT|nr:hypothetical protein [Botrimarina hoheduenensis]TWT46783.1 hypothetical protein Pla111_18840 [Botrimarina hoheduenensis]
MITRDSLSAYRQLGVVFLSFSVLTCAGFASAAVTAAGSVNPTTVLPGNQNIDLLIGDDSSSNPDVRATVLINGGSQLTVNRAFVGSDEYFFGRLLIQGDGSLLGDGTKLTVDESGSSTEPTLQIGRSGDGYLQVSGGATLTLSDSSGDLVVGDNATGIGRALVTGDFTLVTIGDDLIVGNAGVGRLDIEAGAIVQLGTPSARSGRNVTIGAQAGGAGEVYVTGAGSRLVVGDDLELGVLGSGRLVVSNGALVDADTGANPSLLIGGQGRLTLDGGVITTGAVTVVGVLEGSGFVNGDGPGSGSVTVNSTGRIYAGPGELLRIDDTVSNQGSISIEGGELELLSVLTNNAPGSSQPPGRITLEAGRLRLTESLTNNGVIAFAAGASDVHGTITNNTGGAIAVAPEAVATFYDSFQDTGGTLEIQAGGSALFLADATFSAASSVSLALAEPGPALSVAGGMIVGGDLTVTFSDDFELQAGTFEVIEAGALAGAFDTVTLPSVAGFDLVPLYTGSGLLLTVSTVTVGGPDIGDFNNDGFIDVADYTVWRDTAGTPPDLDGYVVWVNNYGTLVPAASPAAAVPEPTTLAIVLLTPLAAIGRRR